MIYIFTLKCRSQNQQAMPSNIITITHEIQLIGKNLQNKITTFQIMI